MFRTCWQRRSALQSIFRLVADIFLIAMDTAGAEATALLQEWNFLVEIDTVASGRNARSLNVHISLQRSGVGYMLCSKPQNLYQYKRFIQSEFRRVQARHPPV